MKKNENGFTLLEMAVVIGISAMLALTAAVFTFHALRTTGQTRDHLNADSNVQNAAYWISNDAYMADNVVTENLAPPVFLVFNWTEWGYGESNIYHYATYSVDNITDGVGQLKRRYQDSNGTDQQTLVGRYVYFNLSDPANTTSVTYENRTVSLKMVIRSGIASEVRDYLIHCRPDF